MSQSNIFDVAIIGAGITGLTCAWQLRKAGHSVCIIDQSDRPGGAINSIKKSGFVVEEGPTSILVKDAAVWKFIKDLPAAKDLVEANHEANKRYLVKGGKLVALPMGPIEGLTTPLYSLSEKLRVLKEPFIPKTTREDESVTDFVSRRLGTAFLEYGISALVSGIYAGNPDTLSIRSAFPKVWNLEQTYGSLIKGALRVKKDRKKQNIPHFKSRMISFKGGLSTLINSLLNTQNSDIFLNALVSSIEWEKDVWDLNFSVQNLPNTLKAKKLVVATPAHTLHKLPFPSSISSPLKKIPLLQFPPLSTLTLGFRKDQINHPLDGFGALFPRMESRFCLGTMFSSTIFPNRVPKEHVSLTAFVGGIQAPEKAALPEKVLLREVINDLRPLLGIEGNPIFKHHTFWPRAIPQYNIGHEQWVDKLEDIESRNNNLYFQSNYKGGPGISDCIKSALTLSENIAN